MTLEPAASGPAKVEAPEEKSEGEDDFAVPLPNFNTVPIKVRRLVDNLPDYAYLFE